MLGSLARYRRLLISLGLLACTVLFLVSQRHDLATGFGLVLRVEPIWFVALLTLQIVLLAVSAMTYQTTLRLLGHHLSLWRLIDIHLQRHLIGTIAPLGGPASVYVFVRALGQRGICANDALFVIALRGGVGALAFALLVVPTVFLSHPPPIIAAAAAMFAGFVILTLATLALLISPLAIRPALARWLPRRVLAFATRARDHGVQVRGLAIPFALAMLSNLGSVAMLFISLRAVGEHPSIASVGGAYSIGNVLQMVAPVSQGLGLVEVTMAAAIQQVGVAGAPAIAATLLFRLGDLWTPLVLALSVLIIRQINTTGIWQAWRTRLLAFPDYGSMFGIPSFSVTLVRTRLTHALAARVAASTSVLTVATDLWRWPIGMAAIAFTSTAGSISIEMVSQPEFGFGLMASLLQANPLFSQIASSAFAVWL